jgi:hypothetical protein
VAHCKNNITKKEKQHRIKGAAFFVLKEKIKENRLFKMPVIKILIINILMIALLYCW